MKASAKDLRFKTRQILSAIERGEEVIITYRGKDKARMVPIDIAEQSEAQECESSGLFGIWRDNPKVKDVDKYLQDLRGGRFGSR